MDKRLIVPLILVLTLLGYVILSRRSSEQSGAPRSSIAADSLGGSDTSEHGGSVSKVALPPDAPLEVASVRWPDSLAVVPDSIPRFIQWNFFSNKSRQDFRKAELDALAHDGFFLKQIPPPENIGVDDMSDLYTDLYIEDYGRSYCTVPVFITSDYLLHTFHLIFDRMVQDIEEKRFLPTLTQLTLKLALESAAESQGSVPSAVRDAFQANAAFFTVAAKLAGDSTLVITTTKGIVDRELALVSGAAGFGQSPLFQSNEDYSQYKPRGHYTVNENLSRYFKTMMWYGRRSFSTSSEQLTLRAILITQLLARPENKALWESIEKPLEFIAGKPDDLALDDYAQLLSSIYGGELRYADLADTGKLHQFMDAASKLASPRISGNALHDRLDPNSTERGFRFLGQRSVPDAVVFNDLTSPRVGDDAAPRNIPTVNDVLAVLGSSVALEHEKQFSQIPRFDETLTALRSEYQGRGESAWTSNLYWSWLNTLRALLVERGDVYPPFMQGKKWAMKAALTASASWTELKHDSMLFSKQSYAESGEGEDEEIPKPPAQPKSYVEPDMAFFNRLITLAYRTRNEFITSDLLSDEYRQKLDNFIVHLLPLREIVKKELEHTEISTAEYDVMLNFAREIAPLILPWGGGDIIEPKYKQMALVSDVHTDAFGNQVLEEAIGSPQQIFVVVRDASGGTRVCVGYTYSHYEFTRPMSQRMTDDEWKANAYEKSRQSTEGLESEWSKALRIPE